MNETCRIQLEKHKEIFSTLHTLIHELRDYMVKAELMADTGVNIDLEAQSKELFYAMVHTMDDVARLFSSQTGVQCSCCLKLFTEEMDTEKREKLVTFCRDRDSDRKRGRYDRRETFTVEKNADFHYIMHSDENVFFSNNLEKEAGYNNERNDWNQRYASAVVLPIQRTMTKGEPEDFLDILGFLCIDSLQTDVFDKRVSVEIGGCIADNLYWPLHQFLAFSSIYQEP